MIKLTAILRESRDRQMVTGVAEILRGVEDQANRRKLAQKMVRKFESEGVTFDEKEFMSLCKVKKESVQEVQLRSTGRWEDADMASIDPVTMEEIFQLYKRTYDQEGLDLSVNSGEEMRADYKALKMQDVDGDQQADCFIIYKPVPGYGNKISLLFTNRKPGTAREVITKVVELCTSGGWFLEASKKMEDIMSRSGAPVIEDEETIKGIIGPSKAKTVRFLGDGYYERVLGGVDKRIVKRLYGSVS